RGGCGGVWRAAAVRSAESSSRRDLRGSTVVGPTPLDHGNAFEHGLTGSPPVGGGLAAPSVVFRSALRDSPNCNRANPPLTSAHAAAADHTGRGPCGDGRAAANPACVRVRRGRRGA